MTEERFDELLKEMREETPPPEQETAARDRVWQQISGPSTLACSEFRPDFKAYIEGRLSESRRLLVEDHLGRCVRCRQELPSARPARPVVEMPPPKVKTLPRWTRWAVAAGVALAALYLGADSIDSALAPSGPRATVVSVSGALYKLPESTLAAGAELAEGEVVRTTAGSHAILRLADGSEVEMNQRTELAVRAAWSGQTIRLAQGDVIVEAAKQRRGRLRVVTRDSTASVKGTVFAVTAGTAGSLVTVVEGSVAVSQADGEKVLAAGKQAATSRALQHVSVIEAIAWSEGAEKYYTLLAEFADIEKSIAEMPGPAMRTQPRLLPFLPANTLVYFAIPNLENTVREAMDLIDRRANENPVLAEWWNSVESQEWREGIDRIQAVTPLLGEEVVFLLTNDAAGGQIALLLAQVQPGREDALRTAIEQLAAAHTNPLPYQIAQGLLLMSDSAEHLTTISAQLGSGSASGFATEIAARYQRGVSWLTGVDAGEIGADIRQSEEGRMLGLTNMRYVFFEQNGGGSRDEIQALAAFEGSRIGIASWLAPPGAAGSAEYVSSEAVLALSASTRDPRQAFDELLGLSDPERGFAQAMRDFETETGINIANDVASSLGTDFTFAIERPTVPIPGWVATCEVIRPAVLDDAVRRIVEAHNARLTPEQSDRQVTLLQETVNGRIWNSAQIGLAGIALHWTYDRGYLIASTDRALALRAIGVQQAGTPLVRSLAFQQRYPFAAGLHNSGFVWFNTNGVLADLASAVQSPAVQRLVGSREPVLIVIDGGMERIRAIGRTRLTSLVLDLMLAGRGYLRPESGDL